MRVCRVLHLVGSPTSDFYRDLSEVYARGAIAALADPSLYDFIIALVTPDGAWRFPASLAAHDVAAAGPLDRGRALAHLATLHIDAALPQMFCHAGMIDYRALLDVLEIPYLGNRPMQMALAADKAMTRAIVASAGVAVPPGELLRRDDSPTLPLPVVVKPNASDNSDGVHLVTSLHELTPALDDAFAYGATVLVERFVELGREVRCGIVERAGVRTVLPLEEYFVDARTRPIRTREHKLKSDGANGLALAAKTATQSWIVDAADPIVAPVAALADRAYVALGCRQYGLFDFRIDPQGRPWFLEAGLYCSFSPQSVIATMMVAAGIPLDTFFATALDDLIGTHAERPANA